MREKCCEWMGECVVRGRDSHTVRVSVGRQRISICIIFASGLASFASFESQGVVTDSNSVNCPLSTSHESRVEKPPHRYAEWNGSKVKIHFVWKMYS